MNEMKIVDTCEGLDVSAARDLLQEHGYGLICRFGHVHATSGGGELHLCLVAELASMCPSRLLECLDEAIKQSLQGVMPLVRRV